MKVLSVLAGGHMVTLKKNAKEAGASFAADNIRAELTPRGFIARAEQVGLLGNKQITFEFPFNGSKVERVDASRNLTSGAIGAAAGGLLLGPLGLVAGGLLGSSKKILYTVTRGSDIAIVELSPSEEKSLLGRGFSTGGGSFASGKPSPEKGRSVTRYCVSCQSKMIAHVPNLLFGIQGPKDGEAICSGCSGRC